MSCLLRNNTYKIKIIKGLSLICMALSSFRLIAQSEVVLPQSGNTYIPLNSHSYHLVDRMDIQYKNAYQFLNTSTKPYLRENISGLTLAYLGFDSLNKKDKFNTNYLCADNEEFCFCDKENYYTGSFKNVFYRSPATFYQYLTVRVNPVIHNSFGSSSDTSALKFVNTRGIEIRGSVDNKVGFYFYASDNQAQLPRYVQERTNAAPQVVPGEGVVKKFKTTGVDYLVARGYFTFNATKHISFQFGQDKIFIGDGIRSMIWSDNSKDQLLLKINTRIGRFNYQNIFTELANYDGSNIYNSLIQKKYAAIHHLSVPITKTFTLGAFESVIFDRTDYFGNVKGFELNYLNPIIFYRAVESGLGSSDNVLLGLNWKWNFLQRFSFYGQVVLDEFVFGELLAGDGWWGNKYAAQAGLKYIDLFNISNLDLQFEHNFAKPYTYAYDDENGSSYTHYAQAIAHPLGANFSENIISLWYQPIPKFTISNNLILSAFGSDTLNSNWGSNIFLDYNTYENAYGNFTGQGVKNTLLLNDLILSFQFWHNVFIDTRITYRKLNNEIDVYDSNEFYFSVGVRMNEVLKYFYF